MDTLEMGPELEGRSGGMVGCRSSLREDLEVTCRWLMVGDKRVPLSVDKPVMG